MLYGTPKLVPTAVTSWTSEIYWVKYHKSLSETVSDKNVKLHCVTACRMTNHEEIRKYFDQIKKATFGIKSE